MKLSESVDAIMQNESLALNGFYDRLFERYPEFRDHFSNSNVKRQTVMLTMALVGVKQYPELRGSSRAYLQVLGAKHRGRGIERGLYAKFSEVLVETIAAFHGEDWTESLHRQWTDALSLAVGIMHEGPQD
jgi:hemoglobin-like flavoprotein